MFRYRALSALLFVAALQPLAAQKTVRLNLYGGYTFADKLNFDGYYGYDQAKINESAHFGGGLEVLLRHNQGVEIYYQYQGTTGRLLGTLDEYKTDLNVSYLMLGGLHYVGKDKLQGFGGLMLGAAFFNSEDVNSTKFGIGGRLGLMINASEKIGIRLGAQVLSAVQGAGGGMYFGTGGAGAGVSTYSSIYQFGLFGGLAFSFGGSKSSGQSSAPPPPTQPAPSGTPPPPPPPQH